MGLNSGWTGILAVSLILYSALMLAISWRCSRQTFNAEDYLVAGRHLPWWLASFTLLATWYGAGTLLTVADEVSQIGLAGAFMDPLGAGLCLFLAGWWVARPLWSMGLLTVGDFFRSKYDRVTELMACWILVPSYFGWIAAQFVALAELLDLFFGIPTVWGLVLVAMVGTSYTLLGGMWAVAATDAIQMTLVVIGVLLITVTVWSNLTPDEGVAVVAAMKFDVHRWAPVALACEALAIGALGNLSGQDLIQRILSARSPNAARTACFVSGTAYWIFGGFPVFLGLVAASYGGVDDSAVMSLAMASLHPIAMILFALAVVSAVLSTIDSAILSPAGILAQNLCSRRIRERIGELRLNRWCVVLVALFSYGLALLGSDAYSLLESAYSLPLVGLLIPFLAALWSERPSVPAAWVSMITGVSVWWLHGLLGDDWFGGAWLTNRGIYLPLAIMSTLLGGLAFLLVQLASKSNGRRESPSEVTDEEDHE